MCVCNYEYKCVGCVYCANRKQLDGLGGNPHPSYNQAIVVLTENLCLLVCLCECGIKSCRVCIRFHFQLLQVKVWVSTIIDWLVGSSNNHHHHFNLIVYVNVCLCVNGLYGQVFVCERYPLLLFVCLLLMHVFGFDSYCWITIAHRRSVL